MLVKEQSRLDVAKYSFTKRIINVGQCNTLSTDCVPASNVNNIIFKNRIDTYLAKAGYT